MFVLDSRLQQDTLSIGPMALSELLLMNDARYPWCILVPRQENASEIFHLSDAQQNQWWQETHWIAQHMQAHFQADKMNIATLGNSVKQLHMHVIARSRTDAAWPAPVWGKHPPMAYTNAQAQEILGVLRALFQARLTPPVPSS